MVPPLPAAGQRIQPSNTTSAAPALSHCQIRAARTWAEAWSGARIAQAACSIDSEASCVALERRHCSGCELG